MFRVCSSGEELHPCHDHVLFEGEDSGFPCRWSIGVDLVQPVAILSAIFCVICRVLLCVCARSVCQAGCAYVKIGLMNCLYSVVIDSLE